VSAPARGTLRRNVREMPRTVWILFGCTFINRFGTFVLPFLVLYMRDLGYSAPQAGIAVSMYGVGGICAVGIGGLLADRIGRRNSVAVSMFGSAVATLALSQAHTLGSILPLTALVGLFAESYRPAASALIADYVPPERRVTAFALNRLAVNLGWAFGPALGGIMASRSFFILFAADAATSAVYGVIALIALPRATRSGVVKPPGRSWPTAASCCSWPPSSSRRCCTCSRRRRSRSRCARRDSRTRPTGCCCR
jgi:MFS family permease